jgi:hypothetical protein
MKLKGLSLDLLDYQECTLFPSWTLDFYQSRNLDMGHHSGLRACGVEARNHWHPPAPCSDLTNFATLWRRLVLFSSLLHSYCWFGYLEFSAASTWNVPGASPFCFLCFDDCYEMCLSSGRSWVGLCSFSHCINKAVHLCQKKKKKNNGFVMVKDKLPLFALSAVGIDNVRSGPIWCTMN